MNKIRALRADEVEVRVQQINKEGFSLLLYKDARCDKRILDETFGIFGWQDKYEVINGILYCTVSVWDEEKKQWISKQDCGTESNTEKQKGQASDAFKRACYNWGIGRELYTKIFIWINGGTVTGQGNKYELEDKYRKFFVGKMIVNEETEKITDLTIVDEKGEAIWTMKKNTVQKQRDDDRKADEINDQFAPPKVELATPEQIRQLQEACFMTGTEEAAILKAYKKSKLENLTAENAAQAIRRLNAKADGAA